MTALDELRRAYMMWRIDNQVPDSEAVVIRVTFDFRMRLLHCDVRADYWMEQGGRNPKERIFGCPMEAVREGTIDGDFAFIRENQGLGWTPEFLINPYHGGDY